MRNKIGKKDGSVISMMDCEANLRMKIVRKSVEKAAARRAKERRMCKGEDVR
jgi:hypothetical protein